MFLCNRSLVVMGCMRSVHGVGLSWCGAPAYLEHDGYEGERRMQWNFESTRGLPGAYERSPVLCSLWVFEPASAMSRCIISLFSRDESRDWRM